MAHGWKRAVWKGWGEIDMEESVLGVDVGGTKVRYGLVASNGEILAYSQYETERLNAREWTRRLISELTPFLKENGAEYFLRAIGLGVRGSVDHGRQRLRTSSVVENAAEYDICGELSREYGVPVFMENDVKAVALYELMYGVGREERSFACVNIGTGLAMGLVMDGVLIRGRNNNAGEIGNMLYERPDSGEIDAVESVVSGQGLELERKRLEKQYGRMQCGQGGKAIADACRRGDPVAQKVMNHMIRRLALIMLNLEAALDIGTYVLVGGVMSDDWIRQGLMSEINRLSRKTQHCAFRWNARILLPRIGTDNAGLCGAASVAYYALKNPASNKKEMIG